MDPIRNRSPTKSIGLASAGQKSISADHHPLTPTSWAWCDHNEIAMAKGFVPFSARNPSPPTIWYYMHGCIFACTRPSIRIDPWKLRSPWTHAEDTTQLGAWSNMTYVKTMELSVMYEWEDMPPILCTNLCLKAFVIYIYGSMIGQLCMGAHALEEQIWASLPTCSRVSEIGQKSCPRLIMAWTWHPCMGKL